MTRLLARAAIIAGYGMVSDIVHFDIANIEVAMLGAGRLGFRPDQYRAAMDDFGRHFAASQVASAGRNFLRNWDRPNEVDEAWRGQVEQATRAEFGFPLSTLLELLTIAIEIGLQNPPIVRTKYEDAVTQFAQRAGWDEQTVRTTLEMFLSRPRKDFFPKENGFTREDVYPWRVRATTLLSAKAVRRRGIRRHMAHLGPSPCERCAKVSSPDLLWWATAGRQ